MDNIISFQYQQITKTPKEEEDEEETLSLTDFPLNSDHEPTKNSSSQPSDHFEFFNDLNSENMSHAEDIISCGKLVPYNKKQPLFDHQILRSLSPDGAAVNLSRRYCESLPEMGPTSTRLTLSSRSLDSQKLRRNSSLMMKSEASEIRRSFSKPRWCVLKFGLVKFPPEMDLRDMKNRQVRRNPGNMFPAGGRSDRRSSWGDDLLRVLSCKNHASVEANASIGFVPQL